MLSQHKSRKKRARHITQHLCACIAYMRSLGSILSHLKRFKNSFRRMERWLSGSYSQHQLVGGLSILLVLWRWRIPCWLARLAKSMNFGFKWDFASIFMVKTGRERGSKTTSDLHKFIYILIYVNMYLPGMHAHSSKNKKKEKFFQILAWTWYAFFHDP